MNYSGEQEKISELTHDHKVYTSICKTVCAISMMLKKISTQTAREITSLFTDYSRYSKLKERNIDKYVVSLLVKARFIFL